MMIAPTIDSLSSPASPEQMANPHFLPLFDGMVARYPDNIAVIDQQQSISYRLLQQRSHHFASILQSQGVQAGDLIAVMLPKGGDLLAVLIAIMRVGAAYVPLDYTHPQKRLALILSSADPVFILCCRETYGYIPSEFQAKSLDIVEAGEGLTIGQIDQLAGVDQRRAETAYVIFTSGSTGTPKGVRIPHGALAAFLLAMADCPGCSAGDRIAALTTIAFDIAGLELFLPLITGAATVLIRDEQAKDAQQLSQLIETNRVTILQATPATFRLLLAGGWSMPKKLRKILCGGEVFSPKLVSALLARAEQVWNMYGPTETTIWSTCCQVTATTEGGQIPIGVPIAGTACCIVDGEQVLTKPNQSGELLIGGLGVAEGYHHDLEKTQQRFVALPGFDQQRFYRTGDRVAYNDQGQLVYLGRMDYQVKIRGFRVEIPEIEHIAMQYKGIDQCVVIASDDAAGETGLFGFYTSTNGHIIDLAGLRHFLGESLPAYMIPAVITHRQTLPLNTNGKVDRHQLANLKPRERSTRDLQSLFSQDLERWVYQAWCHTLGVMEVSMDDNFFALGGHSIAALLLTKKVESLLQKEVPLGLIFQYPVLADFMQALREQNDDKVSLCVPLNNQSTQDSDKPLIYFICGIHLYQDLAECLDKAAKAYALYVESERDFFCEDESTPKPLSTKALAAHYVDLIIKHSGLAPACVCGISYGGVLALEIANQLKHKGKDIDSVFMLDTMFSDSMKRRWVYQLLSKLKTTFVSGVRKIQARQDHQFERAINNTDLKGIDYAGPITLVKARKKMGYGMGVVFKEDYGWSGVLGRDIKVFEVAGDHLGIISGANAQQVADIIQAVKSGTL